MIIKLTECRTDGHTIVWVNFDHVQSFSKSSKGKDTHLKIIGQSYLFVKETPEEIMRLMASAPAGHMAPLDLRERFAS